MQPLLRSATLHLALLLFLAAPAVAEPPIPEEYRSSGLFVGCQAYTWSRFTVYEAIEKTAAAGGNVIEFYPGQRLSPEEREVRWDHHASAETIEKVREWLARHGIGAVNYGVVGIPREEAEARRVFEFARTLGLRTITTESDDAIDTIEKLVKEFDVQVAFHNHPRRNRDPDYRMWDPNHVLALVKDRDRRIGACADTGHWIRSGVRPVEALRILEGRVLSSHLKDLNEFDRRGHDVPLGTGVADIPAILDEFRRQNFQGNISIEYEHNMENSLPEVAQSIGFVLGYARAKGW